MSHGLNGALKDAWTVAANDIPWHFGIHYLVAKSKGWIIRATAMTSRRSVLNPLLSLSGICICVGCWYVSSLIFTSV